MENLSSQNLQQAVNELKVLNDIATTISSLNTVDDIIDQIVLKCIKHLKVEEGTVSLLENDGASDEFHTMIRHRDTSASKLPIHFDSRLKGWMFKNRSILMSNNIPEDPRFASLGYTEYPFHSILCVPLIVKGTLIGYLATFNKKDKGAFSEQDRRLLSIIASQSAQVIENARLYEEEKALLGLKNEMKMARDIQTKLLPGETPDISGIEIAASNEPAKLVGGDYFDFIELDDRKWGFCIGDITGKGMPAALLMANLQATFRSQALISKKCSECLRGTNHMLFRSTEATKFATFFYGAVQSSEERTMLSYANGGHDPPVIFRKGEAPAFLETTGLLLGAFGNSEYEEASMELASGDVLLFYTDGITEAFNKDGLEFGLDRLIGLVEENRNRRAEEIMGLVLDRVKSHVDGAPPSDDITIIILKKR